jgi:hypothetical protein
VWDYLTSPVRRPKWNSDAVIENSPSGRRGTGTVNHCIHGRDAIVEEILDYRPYDYLTVRSQVPQPDWPRITYSQVLEERPDGGTHVEFRMAKPRPRDREAFLAMVPALEGMLDHSFAAIAPLLEAESEARRAGDGVEVPEGKGRFATEPVTA